MMPPQGLRAPIAFLCAAMLGALSGCGGASGKANGAIDVPAACPSDRLLHGGKLLTMPDGVSIWYKLAGRENAPILAYVHGGPGYNSYAFEQSAGKLLEQNFRVLYIDQRGCGRSGFEGAESAYGMRKTIDDIDRIRSAVGAQKLALLGHSFGGLVAAEYAHRYPDNVTKIVMVDTSPYVERAFAQQIAYVDTIAERAFPAYTTEIHGLAKKNGGTFGRLRQLYGILGRKPLQEQLHFASKAKQQEMESVDDASRLLGCTSNRAVAALEGEGYFADTPPGVAMPFDVPALLVAGKESHVIGTDNIQAAAKAWHAELLVVDGAGHFVYFEQPLKFAEIVTAWLRGQPTAPRN